MRALNVWHVLDLGYLKRSQINFRYAIVRFVVDPQPFPIVTAVCLAEHRMVRVSPKRTACTEALVGFRARIVRVAEAGPGLENRNFLNEPAGRDPIYKH